MGWNLGTSIKYNYVNWISHRQNTKLLLCKDHTSQGSRFTSKLNRDLCQVYLQFRTILLLRWCDVLSPDRLHPLWTQRDRWVAKYVAQSNPDHFLRLNYTYNMINKTAFELHVHDKQNSLWTKCITNDLRKLNVLMRQWDVIKLIV